MVNITALQWLKKSVEDAAFCVKLSLFYYLLFSLVRFYIYNNNDSLEKNSNI